MEAAGQGVRREGVEVLQRALRLRPARSPGGWTTRVWRSQCSRRHRSWDQPDRGAPGGTSRPAADRGHPDLGHGRRRGRVPRHQLRDLPRRPPFIDETCWQLIRYPNLYASMAATHQLHRSRAPHVRRDPRQAAVLVRRGQDHLRLGGAAVPSAVGAGGVHGLRDPAGSVRRATGTRSSRSRPSGRSSARTC